MPNSTLITRRSTPALLTIALTTSALAATWTEQGDAGQNGITQAQPTDVAGALTAITGSLNDFNDVDLYRIQIVNESIFRASTVGGVLFDTQLYLFNADGTGQVWNDDDGAGPSTINSVGVLSPGTYYLAISSFNNDPLDTAGLPMETVVDFPGGAFPPQRMLNATAAPLGSWNALGGDFGAYTITIEGAIASNAGSWTELVDANQNTISQAQITHSTTRLDAIAGSLVTTDDIDLYCISITDPANFSASTIAGASFNTQLALFDLQGNGVVFNDNFASTAQSTITADALASPGTYFLAVFPSGVSNGPRDADGNLIFTGLAFFDPANTQVAPDPCPGTTRPTCSPLSSALSLFAGTGNAAGPYVVYLTGAAVSAPRCPATLRVPSPQFPDIQVALNAAVTGDTVLVEPGTYTQSLTLPQTPLTLRSEAGPRHTTIDGSGASALILSAPAGPATRIEGFTLLDSSGATGAGRGALISAGSPTFIDCSFSNNFDTALTCQGSAAPTFDRCAFVANSSANASAVELLGAGVAARFTNCLFAQNTSSAPAGSALTINSAFAELYSCTFADNQGVAATAIQFVLSASATGAHNIFWANLGTDSNVNLNTLLVRSLFTGGSGTNFGTDPQFLDPLVSDYHLGPGSIAIDAGDCAQPIFGVHDLDGAPRIRDAVVIIDTGVPCGSLGTLDLGCYEATEGTLESRATCPGDADGSGFVTFNDVFTVLANWLLVCP